ncbi:MAG: aminotransferase class V-fold PLP-dependent enzyme [Cyanobacteria bacterium]|nr:aminotransferase class V-fold PLP-dependent enzyme [Cyanobacteriota bacterium]MDW8203009.1 aminotransferase class V-fold PLP-dependent enzyme [Cyanobacteriota bacterium SKYGB_h_bin112]
MLTYLNWAGLAPLTWQAYIHSLWAPELLGNTQLLKWFDRVQALKETVAAWLGCQGHQVAFVPSTSAGLIIASQSIPWQVGDLVLYPARDFPANVMPWQQLTRFGVTAIAINDNYESFTTQATSACDQTQLPKLVTISTVDFTTGIEQPWQEVVRIAHQRGIWTCVDAIQSAGVKPSWCPEIDFWCAGTQKWLGAGLGLAMLVLSQRVLDELTPPMPTWLGLNQPPKLESGLSKTARSWELGWATPQAIARFETNLHQFQQIGWEAVSQAVKARRDYLHERLLEMGYPVVSCPLRWSGILSFYPGAGKAEPIVHSGYKRWIITAQRGDYVRLSPHLFTSWRSLAKAVDWLWWCKLNFSSPAPNSPEH